MAEPMAEPTDTSPSTSSATPLLQRRPRVGDIVHVPLDRGPNTGQCRAALVVRVWNDEMVNAILFADDVNDHVDFADGRTLWLTSIHYQRPGTSALPTGQRSWHYRSDDGAVDPEPTTSADDAVQVIMVKQDTSTPEAAASESGSDSTAVAPEVPVTPNAVDATSPSD